MRFMVALSLVTCMTSYASTQSVDLVVSHALIRTMDHNQPEAEAIAVTDGRIVDIGSNERLSKYKAKRKIDGKGRLILPGFNDAHVHFMAGGQQLSSVQLRDAKSPAEFTARILAFAQHAPKGAWITGGDWDHENWSDAALPTRQWIDAVTSEHPVMVRRLDGHMALANTLALRLAGITRESRDPPGGLIVRDKDGEPTGILKDAAMNDVYAKIPDLTHEQRLQAATAATNHAASLGVTSVQDMSGDGDVLIYEELLRAGALKTRIYAIAPLPAWGKSAQLGLRAAQGHPWIRRGGLKGFADGSLGSTTAYFFEPYADDPRTSGLPSDEMLAGSAMQERALAADKAGLQLMIHAIGDRANDQILTIYEEVAEQNGPRDRRARIEHAQHLRLSDIKRFHSSGVIASMQPYHCADDGRWAEKRIGAERAKGTYAFRGLIDAGVTLAFGSDWNVAPLDPIQGLAAAVTRQTLDGRHPDGWVPEQKISIDEAVRAYTYGSAFAEFGERDKGTLQLGKLADFVVLSQNLFVIPAASIKDTVVEITVVNGEVVYQR